MLDLHRKKAAEIFGIPESEVTPEQRRYGKLENFRAIYSNPGKLSDLVGPTTGRISSHKPVFQNFPMHTEQGRKVIEAYVSDAQRLAQPMGQFQNWHDKLFCWSGGFLGWRYVKGLQSIAKTY